MSLLEEYIRNYGSNKVSPAHSPPKSPAAKTSLLEEYNKKHVSPGSAAKPKPATGKPSPPACVSLVGNGIPDVPKPPAGNAPSNAPKTPAYTADPYSDYDTLVNQLKSLERERDAKTVLYENGIYMGTDYAKAADYDRRIAQTREAMYAAESELPKADWGGIIKNSVRAGITGADHAIAKTANSLVGGALNELHAFAGSTIQAIDPNYDYDERSWLQRYVDEGEARIKRQKAAAAEAANGNRDAEKVAGYTELISNALPMSLMAIMSAPLSATGAATTQGLQALSQLAQSGKAMQTLKPIFTGMGNMMKSPNWLTAFNMTAGTSYSDALSDGASEEDAALYAVLNGAFNATTEVGGSSEMLGGLQKLSPELYTALKSGNYNVIMSAVKSIPTEIGEELTQGVGENWLKSLYMDVPLYATGDEDAVINPTRMEEEAKGAAVVSSVLGGGQAAVQTTQAAAKAHLQAISEGKAKSISSLAAKALRMAAVGANSTAIKNHTWCTVTADGDVINANTGAVIAKAPLPPKPPELPNTSEMTPEEYMEKLQAALAESGVGGGNTNIGERGQGVEDYSAEESDYAAFASKHLNSELYNDRVKLKNGFAAFPKGDPLRERSTRVAPLEGYFDVAMHGSPSEVAFGSREGNTDARLLASIIRHSEGYNGQDIRLLSCSTGKVTDGGYCFAEELANALGVNVIAPNDLLYITPSGGLTVGLSGEGQFEVYRPNQRRRRK